MKEVLDIYIIEHFKMELSKVHVLLLNKVVFMHKTQMDFHIIFVFFSSNV